METTEKEGRKVAEKNQEVLLVGIGASAGGLEALQELISHLPPDLENVALIVAQHLSPTYKSMLVQLLSRQTKLEVLEIRHHMPIQANKIYITPPDSELTIIKNYFHIEKPASSSGPKPSIDTFFKSLAHEKKEKSIGIILSGTGSDGALGIRAIKNQGGLTIAQEPQTAKYDGMPISAIESGQVDLVLSPDKIGEELKEILQNPYTISPALSENLRITDEKDSGLSQIFNLLSHRTGTDFGNYKPSTICRRLEKRMLELKQPDIEHYLAFINAHPSEVDELFNNILIGVTSFFRDPEAFEMLEKYLAKIIASKRQNEQIRIWIPGCATGEEAYTFALMLARMLRQRLQEYNIQIFATDIDEKAIATARKGIYPKAVVEKFMPDELLSTYLIKRGDNYEVLKSIRQMILFSKHDITSNPPFLKLDLISCRNLLIYFGQNLQKHIIPIFHYALNPDGYLFLGKSETVGQFTDLFATIEGKTKIFQRKRGNYIHGIKFSAFKPRNSQRSNTLATLPSPAQYSIPEMVKETLFNTFEHSYVVINDSMDILEISGDVRKFLSINPGSMNANILKMINKNLQIELRSVISKAMKDNLSCSTEIKNIKFFSEDLFVRIHIKPLLYSKAENRLFLVVFEEQAIDEKFIRPLVEPSDQESPRITELEQELNSTKEHLQTFIEELETTNEELQSLNEELQSSNEELQSSNEELETSNEELQSTNEELQIAYAELKAAADEIEKQSNLLRLSEANAKALLNNTLQSFVLIDRDYKIIMFNKVAENFYRIIFDKKIKSGDSIIDYQFPGDMEKFHRDYNKALKGDLVSGEKMMYDRAGNQKWFKYNYTPVTDGSEKIEVVSYSFLEITDQKKVEIELSRSEELLNAVFNVAELGIAMIDQQGMLVKINQKYCDLYGYQLDELFGKSFTMLTAKEQAAALTDAHKRFLDGHPEDMVNWVGIRKDGTPLKAKYNASRLVTSDQQKFRIVILRAEF